MYDGSEVLLLIRPSDERDANLPCLDFTTLTAVNTCPTWGIVRYIHQKSASSGGRAMALEAGSACHRVFAADRVWHLWHEQGMEQHAKAHGPAIFGEEHFAKMLEQTLGDPSVARLNFCLEALYSSGFYDDPRDRRRTMSNLEESCIAYLDRSDACRHPIWVKDATNPLAPIGIECGFDVRVAMSRGGDWVYLPFRFVGRIDGLHVDRDFDTQIIVCENKTGARLDDAWRESFVTSHQTTGYCVGSTAYVGTLPTETKVHGLAIPLPKSYDGGGVVSEVYSRRAHQFVSWFNWCMSTYNVIERFKDTPHDADQYTHSCNRYFRPCSLIPFCAESPDQRIIMLDEMTYDPWSPLHDGSPVNE